MLNQAVCRTPAKYELSQMTYNHGHKSLRHLKFTILYSLGEYSPLSPLMKCSLPSPPVQCWKQINIDEAFATLFGGTGGGGVMTDEEGVFIQIQNTVVSLKALV